MRTWKAGQKSWLVFTRNSKQVLNGCFNRMIPNHYTRKKGSFTEHPFKTGCLGFQENWKQCLAFFCAVLFSKRWRDLSNYHHPQTACTVMLVIIPRRMSVILKMDTLLKFNIVPKRLHSQWGSSFPTTIFQGQAVKLRGCKPYKLGSCLMV